MSTTPHLGDEDILGANLNIIQRYYLYGTGLNLKLLNIRLKEKVRQNDRFNL